MVNQGIVLGHMILKKGVEIDQAKFELTVKLSKPSNVKEVGKSEF